MRASFIGSFVRCSRRVALGALLVGLVACKDRAAGADGAGSAPLTKVRYSEVVRSILWTPAYVAIEKGFFKEAGLDVTLSTAQGGDKAVAALLGDSADIALTGAESPVYIRNSESPKKVRIFCGLASTDGFLVVARKKRDPFEWSQLKGKELLGYRPGSTPLLFFETALRKNGLDPQKDVKIATNVAVAARVGSWMAGQNEFGIFPEPDASELEAKGEGTVVAAVGREVGPVDSAAFVATEETMKSRAPMIESWTKAIQKAQSWTATAPVGDIAKVLTSYFPGVSDAALRSSVERYRSLGLWKTSPVVEPAAVEKLQDVLVTGNIITKEKRVPYDQVVSTKFFPKTP
jgi:NitT/TauT family transport system substrate-binding protein